MNRNVLKIIAVLTMLVDHVGLCLFDNNIIFRSIGRLAMPIFAFFIAEGMKHTKNRKKYILTLFVFALISQIPHSLVIGGNLMNILFTFLIAILIIVLNEKMNIKPLAIFLSVVICFISLFLGVVFVVDYGVFGILLVLVFYYINNKYVKATVAAIILISMTIFNNLVYGVNLFNFICLLSVFSIVLLLFYNGKKGKLNLKWFFYVFYPVHLMIIYFIQILL